MPASSADGPTSTQAPDTAIASTVQWVTSVPVKASSSRSTASSSSGVGIDSSSTVTKRTVTVPGVKMLTCTSTW